MGLDASPFSNGELAHSVKMYIFLKDDKSCILPAFVSLARQLIEHQCDSHLSDTVDAVDPFRLNMIEPTGTSLRLQPGD